MHVQRCPCDMTFNLVMIELCCRANSVGLFWQDRPRLDCSKTSIPRPQQKAGRLLCLGVGVAGFHTRHKRARTWWMPPGHKPFWVVQICNIFPEMPKLVVACLPPNCYTHCAAAANTKSVLRQRATGHRRLEVLSCFHMWPLSLSPSQKGLKPTRGMWPTAA